MTCRTSPRSKPDLWKGLEAQDIYALNQQATMFLMELHTHLPVASSESLSIGSDLSTAMGKGRFIGS